MADNAGARITTARPLTFADWERLVPTVSDLENQYPDVHYKNPTKWVALDAGSYSGIGCGGAMRVERGTIIEDMLTAKNMADGGIKLREIAGDEIISLKTLPPVDPVSVDIKADGTVAVTPAANDAPAKRPRKKKTTIESE